MAPANLDFKLEKEELLNRMWKVLFEDEKSNNKGSEGWFGDIIDF